LKDLLMIVLSFKSFTQQTDNPLFRHLNSSHSTALFQLMTSVNVDFQ